ncbi:MAG TPA: hypothetical protein VF304_03475 [Casimicrobiaceae bacterium]
MSRTLAEALPRRADRSRWTAWLVAAIATVATIALLYPGQYPFDSAYQLWQARSGEFNDVSPVVMTALWSTLLRAGAGPAALFCLDLALFWAGIALCVTAIARAVLARIVLVVVLGALPLTLAEMAHVLTDAHLAAVLALASGFAAHALADRRGGASIACIVLLIYAGAVRHNALVAIVPYAFVLASTWLAHERRRGRKAAGATIALCLASFAFAFGLDRALVRERATVWPSIAVWDLAAISVATNTLLLPPFTRGAGLTVDELVTTGAFDAATNTLLFQKTRSGMRDGLGDPYSPDQLRALFAAWFHAVREHPIAYAHHRLRTFRLMIGPHRGGVQGASYFVARTPYRDNPPLPPALAPRAQRAFYALAGALRPGWVFAALPYLLSSVAALALGVLRLGDSNARIAIAIAASALLYASTFVPLAPGAELRYLTWPIVAGPIALAFAVSRYFSASRSARSCSRPDPVRTR